MKVRTRVEKADDEVGSAHVHADLGHPVPQAMLVKAQLVTRIAEILERHGLTQLQAAAVLGIPQPKVSKLLRGEFRGFSERKLMDCLTRLGRDVEIVVRSTPRRRGHGTVSVLFR